MVVGYVFAIRSERLICREMQRIGLSLVLQDRWEDARFIRHFRAPATSASAMEKFHCVFERSSKPKSRLIWLAARILPSMRA